MSLSRLLKGSCEASFFILLLSLSHFSLAQNPSLATEPTDRQVQEIATSPIWQALLHWDGEKHIDDQGFLLSQPNFSPEQELYATLKYLYSGDDQSHCRFPARYLFLQNALSLRELNLSACRELIEFQQRAPIDQLYLIFASENISQPSTMMGHVLIKISGTNINNIPVDHAISFYTEITGINLPKIIYSNMIAGGQGYFTLAPYQEKLTRYNKIENRNVWEYEIASDDFTRKLIQLHLFELKQTQLTYFFKDYNCATLTQFILALADKKPVSQQIFGATPIDIVKRAKSSHLIKATTLIAATKWQMRMLEDSISPNEKNYINAAILSGNIEKISAIEHEKDRFIAYELAQNYAELQFAGDRISTPQRLALQEKIDAGKSQTPNFYLDLDDYKDPAKSPADSQIAVGALRYRNEDYLTLSLLPASHKLEDDNRQYFGETNLALGELSLATSLNNGSAFVDSFTLYDVKSLIPRDIFSGGISGQFKIGMEHRAARDWQKHSQFYLAGALGSSFSLSNDISVYGLVGAGLASARSDTFATGSPEIGMIIKEVFDMKSIVHAQHTWTDSNSMPSIGKLTFTQAFYLNREWAAFIDLEKITLDQESRNQYSFRLKNYF